MYVDGVWWVNDFAKITDFPWDMAMLPKHPKTGKRTTSVESDGWWIFNQAKERDLAWELVKYLLSAPAQTKLSNANYGIPPSNPDVSKVWYGLKPPDHRVKALDNLNQDSKKISTTYFESATIQAAITPVLQKAYFDGQDMAAQVKAAAQVMNQELDKAWKKFAET